jgi:hypothetical protein
MRRITVLVIIGLLGWYGYNKHQSQVLRQPAHASEPQRIDQPTKLNVPNEPVRHATFSCDGRTYCSQMTSCAEATYFLKNCPDVKMDGNNDGVPCEQQWCR